MGTALKIEIETYQQHLPQLLSDEGKYALVHGQDLEGVFDTYADALKAGYEKHGLKPFLVKRISAVETVAYFTRAMA